ncbi:P27 family phage terminase small subunit, partial [Streptococcus agalactiae]
KETTKKLDEIGYFTNDPDKGLIPSPLILTLEKATANIRSSASQLGLTVDSRMKMFIPKEEKKEETLFEKFGGK